MSWGGNDFISGRETWALVRLGLQNDSQLHYMGMFKGPHILDFSKDAGFGAGAADGSF